MVTISRQPGVPDYALRAAEELTERIQYHIEVVHELPVILWATVEYPDDFGGGTLGQFNANPLAIHVSALRRASVTSQEWRISFVDTLVHEFVHYEQFRDGRDCTERGVKVRVKNLLRKMGL